MNRSLAVFTKEWAQSFRGRAIWIELALLGASAMALTFFAGKFFDAGRADLAIWFGWYPLILSIFVAITGARLWEQEFRLGTIDLVAHDDRSLLSLAMGKWMAISAMQVLALVFVLPLWIGISILGSPDQGIIFSGLLGAALMAAGFAGLALVASSMASNPANAALIGILLATLFSLPVLGPLIATWPPALAEALAGFSIPARFSGFARGMVSLSDGFYFVSMAALGIWVSAQIAAARIRGLKPAKLAQMGLMVLAFIAVNLTLPLALPNVRVDLSAGQVYTLSPQGKKIVHGLTESRHWTFYYSSQLAVRYPDVRQFGAQVRQTLDNLQAASGGLLRVSERFPTPDSDLEDAAIAAGLQALMTDTGEPLYFGLVDDNGAGIARFDPDRATMLEYDLLRLLTTGATLSPAVRLTDTTDMVGRDWYVTGDQETALYRQLETQFQLSVGNDQPPANAWMLVHPQIDAQMDAALQARLHDDEPFQALVLVDPYRESAALPALNGLPRPGARPGSVLPAAISALGVSMVTDAVVVDPQIAASVQRNQAGKVRQVKYPAWLQLGPGHLQQSGPLQSATARGLVLASVGAFTVGQLTDGWQVQTLLVSSPDAQLVSNGALAEGLDGDALMRLANDKGTKVLALRLFHPDKEKQILLIADTDFIADRFYGRNDPVFGWQEVKDNGRFVLTLLDILVRAPELINVPPKQNLNRPLHRIEQMRSTAQAKIQIEQDRLIDLAAGASNAEAITAHEISTRSELRRLRKEFRSRIVGIERWLTLICVFLFPLGFVGFGLWRVGQKSRIRPNSLNE
ncbi:MAG: hypothetical protein COA47_05075 [Robiginitomaculum sp.]|nr:MAG: hypothetical protein COA47_05075 [Robiginitomaculum sp.]